MRCEPIDKLFHGSAPSGAHKSSENDRDIRLAHSYVCNPIYLVVYPRSTRLPRLKYFTATLLRERIAPLKIMTSRVAKLREQIEFLEQEIVRISLEEEEAANRAREEAEALAKAVRISGEPCKKSISLIDALDAAIDIGEEYIFATACVKRSEEKLAEYEGFATMSAYEARERLEENRVTAVDLQRKFFPSVHTVLVAMRESETERDQYLEKLGLEVARIKIVIGC